MSYQLCNYVDCTFIVHQDNLLYYHYKLEEIVDLSTSQKYLSALGFESSYSMGVWKGRIIGWVEHMGGQQERMMERNSPSATSGQVKNHRRGGGGICSHIHGRLLEVEGNGSGHIVEGWEVLVDSSD